MAARLRVVRAVRERRRVVDDIVEVRIGCDHGRVMDWAERDMSCVDTSMS